MTTQTFGDLTFWHHLQPIRIGGGWDPGWRPTDGAFADNIGRTDSYWGDVLARARTAYGDPSMRFNTDDPHQDRYLVFGDGTRVPADGSLAYHDSARGSTYLLNTDGSVSPLSVTGHAGDPIVPAGWRRRADGALAPIDDTGHQIAPLLAQPAPVPHGYHDEGGVLTPKNAAGDYYTLGPDGRRSFFGPDGRPISAQQFAAPGPPGPAGGQAPDTDEQQSGRAADAVHELQDAMRQHYGTLSDADEKLSEAMLTAHATTASGRDQLGAIQHDIVSAIDDPTTSPDTPAGQQAYLKFLRGKVSEIGQVIASGTLTADDQAKVATALAGLYADGGASEPAPTAGTPPPTPSPAPAAAPVSDPGAADPGPTDVGAPDDGLSPAPQLLDPTLSDMLGGPFGGSLGADPMSSMLPGALGGLGGLGGGGLGGDPLSGLTGAASPLTGLMSQLRDQSVDDPTSPEKRDEPEEDTAKHADTTSAPAPGADPPPTGDSGTSPEHSNPPPADPQPSGGPGDGAPPAAPNTAPVPTSTVALPDGSSVNAKTPALAHAVSSYLSGTPVDDAYRQAGMQLPPPGTPVTNPADPTQLSCGYLGMFADHYVVAASPVKAFADGQIVPLSTVASSPNFLGWIDPTTLAAATPTVTPAPVPANVGTS